MFETLFKRIPLMIIACISFCSVFMSTLFFVSFCSSQFWPKNSNQPGDWSSWDALLWDFLLVGLFILQHSIMASSCFKRFIYGNRSGIVVERSLYVLMTSFVLYTLVSHWCPVTEYIIWHLDTSQSIFWWTVFVVIHVIAWVLLLGAVLTMDLAELIGLKQVYFYCIGAEYPMKYKSPAARHLYRAMRHPGTSCLTFILWCHPIMTLDRFLLAVMMTLYVSFGFNVTVEDYEYIALQSARKDDELYRYRTEVQFREVRG
ncbi:nurim homolog [Lineus longissimus]|uniref:nurim homolog n=1 Tax=Lineus longissimus TaxID=88925 RepID=UPI002B4F7327